MNSWPEQPAASNTLPLLHHFLLFSSADPLPSSPENKGMMAVFCPFMFYSRGVCLASVYFTFCLRCLPGMTTLCDLVQLHSTFDYVISDTSQGLSWMFCCLLEVVSFSFLFFFWFHCVPVSFVMNLFCLSSLLYSVSLAWLRLAFSFTLPYFTRILIMIYHLFCWSEDENTKRLMGY